LRSVWFDLLSHSLFSRAATGCGRGFVELQRLGDDHSIIPCGSRRRVIPVAHVFEHPLRVALEGISIPTAGGTHGDKAVTGRDATVGHLGRQGDFLATRSPLNELTGRASASAVVPPGAVGKAVAFDRGAPFAQFASRLNGARPPPPPAWRAGVLAHFVAPPPQGDVGLDILNGFFARIGERGSPRVHAVTAVAPAVTPFEDF